jgi:hypothetical protein
MAGTIQTLAVPPNVSLATLTNALRVAFVNKNHPGAITYDPLLTPPPMVSYDTLWYAVLLAAQGQIQS